MNPAPVVADATLDFIATDLSRARSPLRAAGVLALPPLLAAAGLLARRDLVGALEPANLLPGLGMLLVLAALARGAGSARAARGALGAAFGLGAVALLALSLVPSGMSESLAKSAAPGSFWPEARHCLELGVAVSAVAAVALGWALSRAAPGRGGSLAIAALAGAGGLVALTFHCAGSGAAHAVVSHWGQALVVLPFAYLAQRAFFRRRLRAALGPARADRLRALDRLADSP